LQKNDLQSSCYSKKFHFTTTIRIALMNVAPSALWWRSFHMSTNLVLFPNKGTITARYFEQTNRSFW